MPSKLGVYWSVMHRRQQDYDYFKRLQPSVFKIMDGGAPDYQFAREHLPNSLVVARDWALSEQHSDMLKDPIATGKRHAQEWHRHADRLGFDRAKTLVLGTNEPRIWEPGVPEALRQYTIAMCEEASIFGLRVGAMQLSVGWPNNDGPDTPPNWSLWHGVDNAIRANRGALVCHEYWADNGPGENWGWWAGRVLKCPWQVPIVIGETGVDMYVKDGSVPHNSRGWRGRMEPERYARELADYALRMSADKRYVGCAVFASDFASHEWFSFDVEPAYQAILSTPIPSTDVQTHLPVIEVGDAPTPPPPAPAYVIAQAGANLRQTPDVRQGNIIVAIPYGEPVAIAAYQKAGNGTRWAQVTYQGASGWMVADLLGATEPQPTPQPPTGDNWARCYTFVRRWEGGWADHPSDPGGATNKGITLGTYTRWREAQGQPAPTKDDLRRISDAEVDEIYRRWYWQASGADRLSWPLALAQFDTAVNAGVGKAQEMLQKSNGDFLAYMGHLIDWYTRIENFETFGRAWIRRRAEILLEASK